MPENWITYKLTDLGTIARGKSKHRPRDASHLYGGKYPFIQTGDVKAANHRLTEHTQTYSKAGLAQSKLWPEHTMCITIAANIAETAILSYPACFPDSIIGFVADEDKCDIEFVEYLMQFFKKQIQTHSIGSVQDNINLGTFQRVEFTVPPLEEQKSIASILSALDDKIELNLKMNKTLEEMAMALYKHWFVDFGPFQDGEFVDSELGKIPKGWEVKTLEDEFKITIGRTPPRKEKEWFSSENGVKWISIKDMGNCGTYIFNTSEYLTKEAVVKKNVPQVPEDTVILSFKLTVGRVAITTENMVSNEAIAHFLKKKNTLLSVEYLYSALKSFDYNSLGSTSSIATAVNSKTVKSMKILVPAKSVLDNFQQEIFSFFELIKTNSKETQTLTQLRDTLLPKLISGEVRVKDVEKILSEVL
ncbi:restriction endonuclease subunit S [Antarcticibacterium arcticum]|uniref:Restriction endonuclease subunit S n=1 Tax=Antarcticibacterium arcticum TaxID=2585771 RepID=A0A5B8YQ07_9FLAO|nr:restriction endonuclease subunit S [Antarcticibacterium arcticum]QED38987.1 restriction endonuclease subunit S [Antarcticibacterium arcticum]